MGELEYWFGNGDGRITTWTSPADLDLDGDGVLDAVRLDFDGDGWEDDAMWDLDGDGVVDRAVLDAQQPTARHFADPVRDGLWARATAPGPTSVVPAPAFPSGQGGAAVTTDGAAAEAVIDFDGDGSPDVVLVSTGENGRYDTVLVAEEEPGRLTVRLSDSDGDGRLDTVRRSL